MEIPVYTLESLNTAVLENNIELVKRFLHESINLNSTIYGKSPLHIAAEKGYSLIFKLLLDKGADVEVKDVYGETSVHKASRHKNLEILEIILKLENRIPWSSFDKLFLTALECKHLDVIQLLFKNGFKANRALLTTLHKATENKNLKMARLLLQFGAYVDVNSNECETVLYSVYNNGDADIKKFVFNSDADRKLGIMEEYTPLQLAVLNENVRDVELILGSDPDVNFRNSYGQTALHLTIAMESLTNFQLKITKTKNSMSNNKDFNNDNNSPLQVRNSAEKMWQSTQLERNKQYIIELLLKSGASVNAQDVKGFTILHYATVFGCLEIINILLKYGGDPNIESIGGFTPLNLICNYGSDSSKIQNDEIGEKFLLEMIKYGGDVNIPDKSGNGLLHKACEAGSEKIVSVILSNGGNPNLQNNLKETPLHKACASTSREKIISLLLNKGSDSTILDSGGFTSLHWACLFGSENNVREILSKGGNPNVQCKFYGFTPIHMIPIEVCNKQVALLLMENGCDPNIPNIYGNTIFHNACIFSCREIIEIVLSHGGDPYLKNRDGKTPLHLAVSNHPSEKCNIDTSDLQQIITVLLKNVNVNVLDEEGNTPLHEACRYGFEELIKILLNSGADPNIQNFSLNTPLHELFFSYNKYFNSDSASCTKRWNILLTLLDNGGDMNIKNNNGCTPFKAACSLQPETTVRIILENGGNPNIKSNDGNTPLLAVAGYIDSEKLISLMLQRGGDVNIRDGRGNTPLHISSYNGYIKSVRGFMNFIENPNLFNKDGGTPLHSAILGDCFELPWFGEVVSTLLYGGADINLCYKGKTPLEMALGDNHYRIARTLKGHIIMRKCANFHVHLRDLEVLHSDHNFDSFREQCQTEINLLKTITIGSSSVFYFKILVGTSRTLAPLFRNKYLSEIMSTEKYLQLFPIYGDFLKLNSKRAINRQNLQELAWSCIHIFDCLPILCLDKIFSFLEDDDLRVLASL